MSDKIFALRDFEEIFCVELFGVMEVNFTGCELV